MKPSERCDLVCLTLVALIAVGTSHSCQSAIYACVDANGNLIVSDKQEDARFKHFDPKQSRQAFRPGVGQYNPMSSVDTTQSHQYNDIIRAVAEETGVDAHLLHAVIQVESGYNAKAVSPKGAQGLMQLIPSTAGRFGVDQIDDPVSNIRGGARYLKNLLSLFNNDLNLTLAAYNAGEGAVQKYNNTIPPYPETQSYVDRVLSILKQGKIKEMVKYPI